MKMREIIGNTTATPNPRPDWNQTDETKADYIKNKPNLNIYATRDWVREYVYSLLKIGCVVTENVAGGLTYDLLTDRYTVEENDSGGNTITIEGVF